MVDLSHITIIRSNRKTISMSVLPDSTVHVKAPLHVSAQQIESFIKDHMDWIEKQKVLREKTKSIKKQYKDGEKFMYLGKIYTLRVGRYQKIQIVGDEIHFPQAALFRAQKELTNWFLLQAKKIITQQVEFYAKEMKVTYVSISFSDTKSKWGSCTQDDRLQFNWRLVMAPLLVINYVVVHELVHIYEKNHSRAFWSKVSLYNPSYRQQVKWLKLYGNSLTV